MILIVYIFLVISPILSICGFGFGDILSSVEKYTTCQLGECCQNPYIKNNVPDFNRVFGQHLATKELKNILSAFYKKTTTKPLVISLHGTPGTGKNFVADQIVTARYDKGKRSKYVHGFSGRIDFPLNDLAQSYSAALLTKIVDEIKSCPSSTFIFDEVDKMPPGVFESIVGLLDHNNLYHKVDMSKSLFIFISNLGGVEISKRLLSLMRRDGITREETRLSHFETILEESAYNDEGGLQRSRSIEKATIDFFIPFLPLEKRHVEMCINRLIQQITSVPQPRVFNKVLNSVSFEQDTNTFAASGCKKLEARVNAELHTEF